MTLVARFAATGAAISLSLFANASYGWQWGPYRQAGFFFAALLITFDIIKIFLASRIREDVRGGLYGGAVLRSLLFAGLVSLSLFTGFSYVSSVIEGQAQAARASHARQQAAAAQVASLEAAIRGILEDPRSEGCTVLNGRFTRRWCSPHAFDGVPQMTARLKRARKLAARPAAQDKAQGAELVARLAGTTPASVRLLALMAMALLTEIVASLGMLVFPRTAEVPEAPEAGPEQQPAPEPEPHTEADTLKMLAELGLGQRTIARAMTDMGHPMSQPTVSRRLAALA